MQLKNRLLIAIPKKGRLNQITESILKSARLSYYKNYRSDIASCNNLSVSIIFLPAKDIPNYVAMGEVDLGITGRDLVLESQNNLKEQLALNYGNCRLCLLAPQNKNLVIDLTTTISVATSYPLLTKKYFQKKVKKLNLIYLSGSVEIACNLGLADAVIDLVETGETLRMMNLKIVSEILASEAVLIANPRTKYKTLSEQIKLRIRDVCKARVYALIEYNIHRKNLNQGKKITPGSTSPSIIQLENDNWVAVRSLIKKTDSVETMEKLEAIGAKDILICDLLNCRI